MLTNFTQSKTNLSPQRALVQSDTTVEAIRVMQVTWGLVAGGAEMYALTIAANLDARKYQTLLCAIDKGGALEPEIEQQRIPYFVMHRRSGLDVKLFWRMYRLFKEQRVDVVHTHHFNQLLYSFLGAKLAGARIIHMEHSVEFLKRKRLAIALNFLSRCCDKVLAIGSDGARALKELAGIPAAKVEIIRAGVDRKNYGEAKSAARAALGFNDAEKIVVIVARLFPEKNHQLLLEAFAEVVGRATKARLLIVGEGVEDANIRAAINRLNLTECVTMLGVRRDVARLLAASDVFALASDREGLPIAVLEAMAAGMPVVATAVGDLPMVVKDKETGRIVPAKDAKALAAALLEILNDEKKAIKMGENALQAVEEYSLQTMIAKLARLYSGQ
ncbi:MAG: glycosyltransferase [Acidobacteria bacterium]|nr:glycosyltransferase [Acidobacteriota bacterium]